MKHLNAFPEGGIQEVREPLLPFVPPLPLSRNGGIKVPTFDLHLYRKISRRNFWDLRVDARFAVALTRNFVNSVISLSEI